MQLPATIRSAAGNAFSAPNAGCIPFSQLWQDLHSFQGLCVGSPGGHVKCKSQYNWEMTAIDTQLVSSSLNERMDEKKKGLRSVSSGPNSRVGSEAGHVFCLWWGLWCIVHCISVQDGFKSNHVWIKSLLSDSVIIYSFHVTRMCDWTSHAVHSGEQKKGKGRVGKKSHGCPNVRVYKFRSAACVFSWCPLHEASASTLANLSAFQFVYCIRWIGIR